MKNNKKIDNILKDLVENGSSINTGEWQSLKIENTMIEIRDVNLEIEVPHSVKNLQIDIQPHLPWSEDHFLERIGGQPLNPGNQYYNWPFYSKILDDNRFRNNGNVANKFDHSYMERFWPPSQKGIRFKMGDLNDIIDRLRKNPYTRQAYLSIWHPEDQSNDKEGKRVPCSLGFLFTYRDGNLDVNYMIRSCDAVRHLRNDIYMASRLLQYVGNQIDQKLNTDKVGNLKMWIGNLHCFESDVYSINKKLR